jgi:DNA-binding transcriptional LysR family regulator
MLPGHQVIAMQHWSERDDGVSIERARMELKDLSSFIAVAEANGFRRAAEHLDVEQSVLSRRVRNLEDMLGVSLFERNRSGVKLTNAGHLFLADARRMHADLEQAIASIRLAGTASNGRVRIGTVTAFTSGFFRRVIQRWRRDHPDVKVHFLNGEPRELVGLVLSRQIDLACVTGSTWPSSCDREVIYKEPVYVAVHKNDDLLQEDTITMKSLAKRRFIVTRRGYGTEIRDFIISRVAGFGFSPTVDIFDVERATLLSMVGLGCGITLISGLDIGAIYPDVCFRLLAEETVPCTLVWSPENDNPALRHFLSTARNEARQK